MLLATRSQAVMSLGDHRSEIPSSAQKTLPEGRLRRPLSGALMLTSAIGDSRNKNAKNEAPRARTILKRDVQRPDPPASGVSVLPTRSEWVTKPIGGAQKATRMSTGVYWGETKQTSPQSYRLQAGQKRNQVKC